MGFWTGNTPKFLYLYEVHGDEIILPYGTLKQIQPMLKDAVVESDFKPFESIDYGDPIPLYPYQENAVQALTWNYFGILQSKAGSGKTRCGLALIKEYGRRTLWITTTKDLLNQAKENAEEFFDKSLLGTITEGKVNIGVGITFATVQTLCKLDLAQYKHIWDVIICDECHHVGGSPTTVTMFYKVLNNLAARHKFGLTATPHRADGLMQAAFALIGDVVHIVPDEAVADRVVRVGILPIGTGITYTKECLNTDGTVSYAKLINYVTNNPERNRMILDEIIANKGKSCIILGDRLEQLETLMRMLPPDMQAQAAMIHGGMVTKQAKAERAQGIEDMRTGEKKYLFATYSLAREGLDVPRLERLFMASPIKDKAWVIQSIGRIARVFEGKSDPVCYDFVDNIIFMQKMYKKRCSIYRAENCYFIGGE
jgi:superfamily II DNA or RNA helicase